MPWKASGMAVKRFATADAETLVRMLESAGERLKAGAASLDAANVFPVPDGDTGTNMLHTVRAALAGAASLSHGGADGAGFPSPGAAIVSAAMARGAMEGARGNSGIILSQFFRGLAMALDGKDVCSPVDIAQAFRHAESFARTGISDPTEGTILTVLADVARALADFRASDGVSLEEVLGTAVAAAAASVERTPSLLAVLRDAGVVDAGAEGMLLVLEGFLDAIADGGGRSPRPSLRAAASGVTSGGARRTRRTRSYGFCTEFLVNGVALPLDRIRARLEQEGTSVILVGDGATARIHLHTAHPDAVVAYARSHGTVEHLEIQDLDRQTDEATLSASIAEARTADTAIVALVEGEGFAAIFGSMGAVPHAGDPARALDGVTAHEVIVLANSPAGLEAAESIRAGEEVTVRIVPSRTAPEGIAALLAYRFDRDPGANAEAMRRAAAGVKTLEIPNGAADPLGHLARLLEAAGPDRVGVATVYRGAGADIALAERAAAACRTAFPDAAVETAFGGQERTLLAVSLE